MVCHNTTPATVSLMNKLMDELFTLRSRGKRPPLLTPTSEQCEGSALRAILSSAAAKPPFSLCSWMTFGKLQFKPDPA